MTRLDKSADASQLRVETSWGPISVVVRQGKVHSCDLHPLRSEPRDLFRWGRARITAGTPEDREILNIAAEFLKAAFAGRNADVPPYQWPKAAPFTTRVWKQLLAIPRGETLEYGELAKKIGRPGGARAVGRACGANPLPIFIPCHRVMPKDGSLGGFSSGLPWKRLLLEREGCI